MAHTGKSLGAPELIIGKKAGEAGTRLIRRPSGLRRAVVYKGGQRVSVSQPHFYCGPHGEVFGVGEEASDRMT